MIDTKLFDWIGGKKWLSSKINTEIKNILEYNNKIKYYIEPFCGSLGSVIGSIETFKKFKIEKLILNDINKSLINVYLMVKTNHEELFQKLSEIEIKHTSLIPEESFVLNKTKDKEALKTLMLNANNYYLDIRKQFNRVKNNIGDVNSAAYFLFIMYRAFNGLYRENKSGMNNSPYGWTNKKINLENRYNTIKEYNKFFNEVNVSFYNLPYDEFIENFKHLSKESIFYFDPPYMNKDIKENSYNKDAFGKEEQLKLLTYVDNLDYIIYSNHDLDLFQDFFNKEKYKIETVYRKNLISADNSSRGQDAAEILTSTSIKS
jgi:DNA adenine methylase